MTFNEKAPAAVLEHQNRGTPKTQRSHPKGTGI